MVTHNPALPFALEELEVIKQCTTEMWVWIRKSPNTSFTNKLQKIDLDLTDPKGRVCIRMSGFTTRVFEGDVVEVAPAVVRTVAFEGTPSPGWEEFAAQSAKPENLLGIEPDLLREKAVYFFKKLVATVLKLPVERIEADAPLEKYGINSLMVIGLTNELEKNFGSLSKTLFFEYQNLRDLSSYFLETYREQLIQLMGIKAALPLEKFRRVTIPAGR